jgi:hypothetical protein
MAEIRVDRAEPREATPQTPKMVKVTLAQTTLYEGRFVGPGEVEVTEEAAKSFKDRGLTDLAAEDFPVAPAADTQRAADPLAARVGHETAVALRGAGFMDVAQVRDAEDDALLNVPGIGKARLRQIRDVVKD